MELRPFKGWRYSTPGGDISSVIAPPYDILSAADKQRLMAGSDRNIVAVDLPHVPPKEVGPEHEYVAAADLLRHWQATGVLRQDDKPAIYAYRQTCTWAGKTHSRRAILAGVRATPLGQDIIPHEHTFAGPKADRLKLTQHTQVQLSPIFGFFHDPNAAATEAVFAVTGSRQPDLHGELGGVKEELWVVTDAQVIARVQQLLADVPVFIADGHHRYTTAMNYRDALLAAGKIDASHEANFVMFVLVGRDEAGLLVLPTHRIIRGLKADFSLEKLINATPYFNWRRVSLSEQDFRDPDAMLAKIGEHAMAFVGRELKETYVARLTDHDAMKTAAPDQSDAWRKLDVAILHRLVIDRALREFTAGELAIDYTAHGLEVQAACMADAQLGVLLQGTPLWAVEQIAREGGSMPHKSTYFYPKLATGMVLKPLE